MLGNSDETRGATAPTYFGTVAAYAWLPLEIRLVGGQTAAQIAAHFDANTARRILATVAAESSAIAEQLAFATVDAPVDPNIGVTPGTHGLTTAVSDSATTDARGMTSARPGSAVAGAAVQTTAAPDRATTGARGHAYASPELARTSLEASAAARSVISGGVHALTDRLHHRGPPAAHPCSP
jgi:hypothetical protein